MRAAKVPLCLADVGYGPADVPALTDRAIVQTRLLDNAPLHVGREELEGLFSRAMTSPERPIA